MLTTISAFRFAPAMMALAIALNSGPVSAQTCEPHWLTGQGLPGMDGKVNALTTWDPDGAGPEPVQLIAGGSFKVAGTVLANSIAAWNGSSWQPIGGGMPGGTVQDLVVYNGQLVAGGVFTTAGGVSVNNIAAWDGATWQPLGSGVLGGEVPIRTFTVYDGALIAGGDFTTAGAQAINRIARWDGSQWQALSSGTNNSVYDLLGYGGDLIAAGYFTTAGGTTVNYIARWDGASWQSVGGGTSSVVASLTVHEGDLIAGGYFTTAGGISANGVARWDGTAWQALGSGVSVQPTALISFDGNLVAAGRSALRWDGSAWQSMSNGLGPGVVFINALTEFGGELLLGGLQKASGTDDESDWNGILRWDGAAWGSFIPGMNGRIQALCSNGDSLFAAGAFTQTTDGPAVSIARWDGATWQALGDGLNTSPPTTTRTVVNALAIYKGDLIAAGSFSRSGSALVGNVARWNGSAWESMGGGLTAATAAPIVYALATYNGELIAGGAFSSSNGVSVSNIARWDGSSWQPLGQGVNNVVRALSVAGSELIVGGGFTSAGGLAANRVARWNGSSFSAMGPGFTGVVYSMASYAGTAVAGGLFAGSGTTVTRNIARWDGTAWQPLGGGLDNMVESLTVLDGELFAGGTFSTAGSTNAKKIARWDGTSWQALGGGLDASVAVHVFALAPHRGQLIAGGNFTMTETGVSAFWTRWGCPCPPYRRMDLDEDCDIDGADCNLLVSCGSGPQVSHDNTLICQRADADDDGDVDQSDFAVFQRCVTASGQPAAAACAE